MRDGRGAAAEAVLRGCASAAALTLALLLPACHQASDDGELGAVAAATGDTDYAALVNAFVGSQSGAADFGTGGGAGNTFPGAVLPFGMVQFSPDTEPATDNFSGGYSYVDRTIGGFSLTHISGAGCSLYQDIPIMPTVASVSESPTELLSDGLKSRFQARFSHEQEQASPGYYQVLLNPDSAEPIDVRLTATERTGMAQFVFPAGATGSVLIDVGGSAMPDTLAQVTVDPAHRAISGSANSGGFCYQSDAYKLYFYAEFDQPFTAWGTWQKFLLQPGSVRAADVGLPLGHVQPVPGGPQSIPGDPNTTARAGAYVSFAPSARQPVQMRVGISFVSVDNARANLRAENAGWDFSAVQQAARTRWNEALGRIRVSDESGKHQRMFYTALYHALLTPSLFSDANGEYRGFDDVIHSSGDVPVYSSFSGWDTYRTQMPLVSMLFPKRAAAMMQSLLHAAEQSGWLPKWSYANQHTDVMVGDPADLLLAGAYAFGVRDFDTGLALQYMIKGATQPAGVGQLLGLGNAGYIQRPGLSEYQSLGYIPYEENVPSGALGLVSRRLVWGTSSTTLEYALADFAIDRFARDMGQGNRTQLLQARSANWKNVFNPATAHVEPRLLTAGFAAGGDPASDSGFVEGSSAQYSWFVPQDMAGVIQAMGGRDQALTRLDAFFAKLNDGPQSAHAFLGNEPTLFTPWIYAWLGQPQQTGPIVHEALTTLYDDSPAGMPGNDDLGTMSAWWVLASLGLMPAIPGTDALLLNAPLFDRATLQLPGGDVHIRRAGTGGWVRSLQLDGQPLARAWLPFADIAGGAELTYHMDDAPADWGQAPADSPPSYPATDR